MTILQLKVAAATAELKSVTAAAKLLNTSQPNASNSLKLLEEELGFPLFRRTSTGASLTAKGTQFLTYARQILDLNEKAMNLRNTEEVFRLHLGTVNYYAAAEPFFTLCAEHRDDPKTDFRYCSVSIAEGLQALSNHELDLLVAPVLKHQLAGLSRECKNARPEITSICQIPAAMIVRKGHPAISEGRCKDITQGSDLMKDYPYVGLKNLSEDTSSTAFNDSDFVQCSGKIFVDDTNIRLCMIEATNGFGFGLPSSYRMMSQFNIEFFPVKGIFLELFCITRPGETEYREIRDYMTLLKKEMLQML